MRVERRIFAFYLNLEIQWWKIGKHCLIGLTAIKLTILILFSLNELARVFTTHTVNYLSKQNSWQKLTTRKQTQLKTKKILNRVEQTTKMGFRKYLNFNPSVFKCCRQFFPPVSDISCHIHCVVFACEFCVFLIRKGCVWWFQSKFVLFKGKNWIFHGRILC